MIIATLALFLKISCAISGDPALNGTCDEESVIYQGHNVTFPESQARSLFVKPKNLCIDTSDSSIYRNCSDFGEWLNISGQCDVYSATEISGRIYDMSESNNLNSREIINYLEKYRNEIQGVDVFFISKLLRNVPNLCSDKENVLDYMEIVNLLLEVDDAILRDSLNDFGSEKILDSVNKCLQFAVFDEDLNFFYKNIFVQGIHVMSYSNAVIVYKNYKDYKNGSLNSSLEDLKSNPEALALVVLRNINGPGTASFSINAFFKNNFYTSMSEISDDNNYILSIVPNLSSAHLPYGTDIYFITNTINYTCFTFDKSWKSQWIEDNIYKCGQIGAGLGFNIVLPKPESFPSPTPPTSPPSCPWKQITRPSGILIFRATPPGVWAIPINRICLLSDGNLPFRIQCQEDSSWGPEPDDDCTSFETTDTTSELFTHFQHPLHGSLDFIKNLSESQRNSFVALDLYYIAEIFDNINTESVQSNIGCFLESISNLLDVDRKILNESQALLNATDKILGVLDRVLIGSRNLSLDLPGILTKSFEDVDKDIIGVLITQNHSITYLRSHDYKTTIFSEDLKVAFVSWNLSSFDKFHLALFKNDALFNYQDKTFRVDSKIFNILFPQSLSLDFSLEIYFYQDKMCDDLIKKCTHWDFGNNQDYTAKSGKWDFDSDATPLGSGIYMCKYNHTTNFGMLLPNPVQDNFLLNFFTYFGAVLSIIGLMVIFLTALTFKNWRQNSSNKVILNISVCILLEIIFLFVSDKIRGGVFCVVAGALFHYVILSNFLWTLSVGYSSYRKFVSEIHFQVENAVLKFSLFSWGLPAIAVATVVSLDYKNYDKTCDFKNSLCFPKKSFYTYTVFIPICAIQVINLAIYVAIIKNLVCQKSDNMRKHCDAKKSKMVCKSMVLLFFLLGLTWICGIIGVFFNDSVHFSMFSYVFCLSVVFQGFVMFVFYILDSRKTKEMWQKKIFEAIHHAKSEKKESKQSKKTDVDSFSKKSY